ncbi:unnamed protein product [Eruca vesicaria subsp. sativa]|uniref:Disease resistance protein Roq1-like winged-helix domain-containing protein n=1 Tax=Eruca vesicaria subsp. sativa TaxID=29727 RepID=A0ABC8JE61_ERUVS|nr:unnamed protein product [Eruca vesicaria subsp. sativa]
MKNLRFLRIYGVSREDKEIILQLERDDDHMWHQLRLLEWWGCSIKRMPSNFRAENLVEFIMPDSNLKKLWDDDALLNNLKKMDLRRSKKLKELPDLSTATNLEELYLEDCWSLWSLPSSIRYLKKLRKLDMKRCKNLWDLPTNTDLESVHSLNFIGCSKLRSFPQIARNISHLVLDETKIRRVPDGIEDISGLRYISVLGFSNLKYISPNISKLKHLEVMFFSVSDFLARVPWNEALCAVATTTTDNNNHTLLDAEDSGAEMFEKLAVDISLALSTTPKTIPMILDEETVKTLNQHYDDLNENDKLLFLHIACFLNNETYEIVTQLLEDSELDVGGGLEILCEKYLIQISEEKVISMHPVLQKMGRLTVRRTFTSQSVYRNFLMDSSESFDLLIDQAGVNNVVGMSFGVSEMEERLTRDERFRGMKRVKFLRMYKDILHGKEVRVHLVKGVRSMWRCLKNI